MNKEYFWENGLLTDKLPKGVVENSSLWSVQYDILYQYGMYLGNPGFILNNIPTPETELALRTLVDNKNKYHAFFEHKQLTEEGFSRDNFMAVDAYREYNWHKTTLPQAFSAQHLTQPQDIFFGGYANKLWYDCKLTRYLLTKNIESSCHDLNHHGGGELRTEPFLLTFVRYYGGLNPDFKASWDKVVSQMRLDLACYIRGYMDIKPTQREIEIAKKYNPITKPITFVMAQYFGSDDHPNVWLANQLGI